MGEKQSRADREIDADRTSDSAAADSPDVIDLRPIEDAKANGTDSRGGSETAPRSDGRALTASEGWEWLDLGLRISDAQLDVRRTTGRPMNFDRTDVRPRTAGNGAVQPTADRAEPVVEPQAAPSGESTDGPAAPASGRLTWRDWTNWVRLGRTISEGDDSAAAARGQVGEPEVAEVAAEDEPEPEVAAQAQAKEEPEPEVAAEAEVEEEPDPEVVAAEVAEAEAEPEAEPEVAPEADVEEPAEVAEAEAEPEVAPEADVEEEPDPEVVAAEVEPHVAEGAEAEAEAEHPDTEPEVAAEADVEEEPEPEVAAEAAEAEAEPEVPAAEPEVAAESDVEEVAAPEVAKAEAEPDVEEAEPAAMAVDSLAVVGAADPDIDEKPKVAAAGHVAAQPDVAPAVTRPDEQPATRLTGRPLAVVTAVVVVIVLLVAAIALSMAVRDDKPTQGASARTSGSGAAPTPAGRSLAVQWLERNTAAGTRLLVPPELVDDFAAGLPGRQVLPNDQVAARTGDLLVVTPNSGDVLTGTLTEQILAAAPVVARLPGSDLEVHQVTGTNPADDTARASAGTELLQNLGLTFVEGASALRSGRVDERVLVILAGLASQHSLTVALVPDPADAPDALVRTLEVEGVDGHAITATNAPEIKDFVTAQRGALAGPVVNEIDDGTKRQISVTYLLPASVELLNSGSFPTVSQESQ